MYLRNGIVMLDNICKNKKVSLQELYGRPQATQTLCNETKSDTKIVINPNTAKQNLQNLKVQLSNNIKRLCSLKFLYNDICNALGINSSSPSHYGGFNIDGFECSIRVSNHNSNANTYEFNLNNNISLKIRPKGNINSFISSENVTLEEFTYFDYMIQQDKNLVLDIIDSLIGYLSTGEYVDESGLAKKNYSPDLQTISHQRVQQTLQRKDNEDFINRWHMGENKNKNYNKIYKMKNKKVIRLTESDLHKIISESVKSVINEIGDTHRGQYMLGRVAGRNPNVVNNAAFDRRKPSWDEYDDFGDGYADQRNIDNNKDDLWRKSSAYSRMQFNYDTRKMQDKDEQQSQFINWMLSTDGALQNAIDYMKGYDKSAFSNMLTQYEDELGYELSKSSRINLKTALNTWWNYNEAELEDY